MALFKCKMCGGELNVSEDMKVVECDFCGTKQTLPKLNDDAKVNLYDRANHFRRNNEYDKAMSIYENILNTDTTDAEAYWSLVLCRYGIEYVNDPSTGKRVPTVNRAQYTSIYDDDNYKAALKYADAVQKSVYESEANAINEIQKGILAISQNEEPFDVFICYKENGADGRRTQDSVLANELYHGLTNEGFKVFFSRITLEDKLGTAYEPYIFAALNSAKVMVVIGTKAEYFNAVWVKNEWSRFLSLIKNGAKKTIIPAYRDMDPYDLPDEFSHLQAQDMSKLGFMQDIIRGIKKITDNDKTQEFVRETVVSESANGNISALLKRGFMALEDEQWDRADDFFEQALNFDAELAEGYLGKLLAELQVKAVTDLKNVKSPFDSNVNYDKIVRFGDEKLKSQLAGYIDFINERNEIERKEVIYQRAIVKMNEMTLESLIDALNVFDEMKDYKDSKNLSEQCKVEISKINEKKLLIKKHNLKNTDWCISAGQDYTVGLKSDGTVVAVGDNTLEQLNLLEQLHSSEWKDIVAISSGPHHIVGLKSDGTVVAVGSDFCGECEVSEWRDIIAISAGDRHTVGLKSDGTVVATEYDGIFYTAIKKPDGTVIEKECKTMLIPYNNQCNVSEWRDIVAISAGQEHTVGLKSDGTVVVTEGVFEYVDSKAVKNLKDIVAISSGSHHIAGLKSDGTVCVVKFGIDNVSKWTDIVAISAGGKHTVGLKSDGTVVSTRRNFEVSEWRDIVAISAGEKHMVGLKSDGTVVAVGNNKNGQCDVYSWKDIVCPTEAIQYRKEILAQNQPELNQKRNEYRATGVCQYYGGEFKGLLTKKCAKCGSRKDY